MKLSKNNNKATEATDKLNHVPLNKNADDKKLNHPNDQPKEYGGRKDGLEPTRYGDWEKNGRCIDF